MEFCTNELRASAPEFVPRSKRTISSRADAMEGLGRIMSLPKNERTAGMYQEIIPYMGEAMQLLPSRFWSVEMALSAISVNKEDFKHLPTPWQNHPAVQSRMLWDS